MRKIILSLLLALTLSTGISAAPIVDTTSVFSAPFSLVSERLLPSREPKDVGASSAPTQNKQAAPVPTTGQASNSPAASSDNQTKQQLNAKKIAALRKTLSNAHFLYKVEQATLDAQNAERERLGLAPLIYDQDLQTAARQRSYELYASDTFAHERPDGREWYTVLQEDVPYTFAKAGENLCTAEYNDPTVQLAYDPDFWTEQWINSPTHYKTMIDPDYTRAGVGIYCVKKDGMTYAYATTLFSKPAK